MSWIATIHGGMWEIFEYSPRELAAIEQVNKESPGEVRFLGILPTYQEAVQMCSEHISPEQHRQRSAEITALLEQLIEHRKAK